MVIVTTLIYPLSFAQVIWVDGGMIGAQQLSGDYTYQEVTFITGEPVLVKGLISLPTIPANKDTYTLKYAFTLENTEKGIIIDRSVTYDVEAIQNGLQTTYSKTLKSYSETIETPKGTYTLAEGSLFESRIYENTPAVDYYSGNIYGKRTYYLNGDYMSNEGYVTYDIEVAPIIGYSHEWGDSETRVENMQIDSYVLNDNYTAGGDEPEYVLEWDGTVDLGMSSTQTTNFFYQNIDQQTNPSYGSYFEVRAEDNVLTYSYDLPVVTDGEIDTTTTKRATGEKRMTTPESVILSTQALVSPKILDIGGHWAQNEIFLLTSLGVFDADLNYFVPDASISRLEFGKAMVVATAGILPVDTSDPLGFKRLRPGTETQLPFLDVDAQDPDYDYILYLKEHDLMSGKNYYFKGDEPLTRAEAIAIMIRALGIQYKAPAPPYSTGYVDDASIPEWAKDYIYMANEIGLVTGTPDGYIHPNQYVTKAEAAAMIYKFVQHLKDEITYDYRDKVLNR